MSERNPQVLVAGAGPVGLTLASELRRHGASCRIVDALAAPTGWCKAVGVQARTIEVWDDMGLALDAIRGDLDPRLPRLQERRSTARP